jgi:hypothetical protein
MITVSLIGSKQLQLVAFALQSIIWHCIRVEESAAEELLNCPCWTLISSDNTGVILRVKAMLVLALEAVLLSKLFTSHVIWFFLEFIDIQLAPKNSPKVG